MSDFPNNLLQNPSGFPEFLPKESIAEQELNDLIRKHFELSGFTQINTPLVERTEVLTAKSEGEINTQMYGLRLMNPSADSPTDAKDLVLRFDHTVPLARYIALRNRELTFPFKRYTIGPVFRGEKPKEGRYRQFNQADIDIIGDSKLDTVNDAECVSIVVNIFKELNIGQFVIRIGNRKLLQSLTRGLGVEEKETKAVLQIIDKAEKVGVDKTIEDLKKIEGIKLDKINDFNSILFEEKEFIELEQNLLSFSNDEKIHQGISEVKSLISGLLSLGVSPTNFKVDLSIARGLDYYTGNVFETMLVEYPELGSIASGGRYDNLAGSFTNKDYPGVGISIGTTRLLTKLIKVGLIKAEKSTTCPVIITTQLPLEEFSSVYLKQAKILREAGIKTEVYLTDRSLIKELEYANKKGFKIAIITGEQELKENMVIVKDLTTGNQEKIDSSEIANKVKQMLSL